MGKLVKEIMAEKPVLISKDASIQEAAKKMAEADVGVLPVWDEKLGAIIGMVTDRDIVVRGLPAKQTLDFKVSEVMSQGVHHINEDAEVTAAAHYMGEKQLRRLMVTNKEKKFVGIISLGDIRTPGTGFSTDELSSIVFEVIKGRQMRRKRMQEESRKPGQEQSQKEELQGQQFQKEELQGKQSQKEELQGKQGQQGQQFQKEELQGKQGQQGQQFQKEELQGQQGQQGQQFQKEELQGKQGQQGQQFQKKELQGQQEGEELISSQLYESFQQGQQQLQKGIQGQEYKKEYQQGQKEGEKKEGLLGSKKQQQQQQQPSFQTSQ